LTGAFLNAPLLLATPMPRKHKGKALVGMATPAPRVSSSPKAPIVVVPCMGFTRKKSTPQEYVWKQPHLGNKFLKEHHLKIFAEP